MLKPAYQVVPLAQPPVEAKPVAVTHRKRPMHECPSLVVDTENDAAYSRGSLLGEGGFARCYDFVDMNQSRTLAGKVVAIASLENKPRHQEKLESEIKIHRALTDGIYGDTGVQVVSLESVFRDNHAYYLLMHKCAHGTLGDLMDARKRLTEPAA
ncbi:hypothetical protein KIPB_009714, partial [Kipferlia bialata]|eukprot:g9714.t1